MLHAYRDVAGVLTIGIGHTNRAGGHTVTAGQTITRETAFRILAEDLRRVFEPDVNAAFPDARQHEFDAAVSFHFNTGAIRRASWVRSFRDGRTAEAMRQLLAWNKARVKGALRAVTGLARRRQAEWRLLRSGEYGAAAPEQTGRVADFNRPAVGHSAEVADIQAALGELGWYRGKVNGLVDGAGLAAVRAFQQAHPDLVEDGKVGPATAAQIERALALKRKTGAVAGGSAVAGGGTAAGAGAGMIEWWAVALVIAVAAGVIGFLAWRYWPEVRQRLRKKETRR